MNSAEIATRPLRHKAFRKKGAFAEFIAQAHAKMQQSCPRISPRQST
jgi:hypothetical protein